VSLDPYVKHLNLTAHFVKPINYDKKIKVHFDNDHGRVKVTVDVPPNHPAGKYRSDILDDSDRTCGVLTVEIPEPPKVQTEPTVDEFFTTAVKNFHIEKRNVEDLKRLAEKLEEFLKMLKDMIATGQ